jgi:hypothetical protein
MSKKRNILASKTRKRQKKTEKKKKEKRRVKKPMRVGKSSK